jgi:hypothetical protein
MNNKVLGAIVAVIVIALVGYFAMANKGNEGQEANNQNNQAQNSNTDNDEPQKTSLKGLLSSGSQQCTYSDAQSSGTVYTANGKARIDMSSVTNGVTTNSHAIVDNQTYYGWVDGQPSGFKFSIAQSSTGSAGSNQNVDVDKQVDYDCDGWSVDNSKFNLPANVQFTDLSSFQVPGSN